MRILAIDQTDLIVDAIKDVAEYYHEDGEAIPEGTTVTKTTESARALDLLQSGEFDIVIVGELPFGQALNVARTAKQRGAKIVALVQGTHVSDSEDKLRAESDVTLTMPATAKLLAEAIRLESKPLETAA